ncbi:hypothetical protein VSS74_24270 [Conexibacter stalactiti]|uniref:Delta-60 repeat domain-containing protein n=1 Tax=Conexibacter stalactiti TaxID=1940611 RepID=A0ABU4HXS3_9ACTN|nr:hypothetical protein [Conexibacter stalactiti]MDW5597487.1 hypothetical protein [Conexibacter stalactiti]MEC5038129.1 hypothetical protein [Conexibacter stalactiti]
MRLPSLASLLALLLMTGPAAASAVAAPGQLDPSFGTGGAVEFAVDDGYPTDVAAYPGGGAVVALGWGAGLRVARLTEAGRPDTGFSGDGRAEVAFGAGEGSATAVAVDGQGRIVLAGGWEDAQGRAAVAVARLLPDGSPDASFGIDGGLLLRPWPQEVNAGEAVEVAVGPGDVVDVLEEAGFEGAQTNGVVRLSATGAQLHALRFPVGEQYAAVAAAPGGGLVLAGRTRVAGVRRGALRRLTAGYAPDPGFLGAPLVVDLGGESSELYDVALRADGSPRAASHLMTNGPSGHGVALFAAPDGAVQRTVSLGGSPIERTDVVAVRPDGSALFAGLRFDEDPQGTVLLRQFTAAGEPDPARGDGTLIDPGAPLGFEEVERWTPTSIAVDCAGRALLVAATEGPGARAAVVRVQDSGDRSACDPPKPPDDKPRPPDQPRPPDTPRPPEQPRPPDGGEVVIGSAPAARFGRVGARRVTRLAGSAASGTARVEVALVRRDGRRCRALTSTRPRFGAKPGACTPRTWLKARGTTAWSLKLARALPPGRYVAWVRATALHRIVQGPFTVKRGNRVEFRVKR